MESGVLSGSSTARGEGVMHGESPAAQPSNTDFHAYPRIFPPYDDDRQEVRAHRPPIGFRAVPRDCSRNFGFGYGRASTPPSRAILSEKQRRRLRIDVSSRVEEEGLLM